MTDHRLLNTWVAAHTALLVDGQARLNKIVGTDLPSWELNSVSGLLTINGHRLQCALVGSVGDEDHMWTWAWADPSLTQSDIAVHRCHPLRSFGREAGLWEFVDRSFSTLGILDLGMTPGATVAIVASPQIMGSAIFSAPEDHRRLYFVITDPLLTLDTPTAFMTPQIFTAALSYGLGNHKDIVAVYAAANQLDVEEVGSTVVLTFKDNSQLKVNFNEEGHLCDMEGILSPDQL